MKTFYILKMIILSGFILIATSSKVLAGDKIENKMKPNSIAIEPLALRKIMSELGKNMKTITNGISHEDWNLVEKSASKIAEHPQPPLVERIKRLFSGFIQEKHMKRYLVLLAVDLLT